MSPVSVPSPVRGSEAPLRGSEAPLRGSEAPLRGLVGPVVDGSALSTGGPGQVIVMVGLPARGKTYIAKKLTSCLDI